MRTTHTLRTRSTHSGLLAAPSLLRATTRIASPVPKRLTLSLLATFLLALLIPAAASAGQTHIFLETFGSAAQPSFSGTASATVDQATGDLLVIEQGAGQISRYHSDGTPSAFSALATNVIDGKGGADLTPQDGLAFGASIYSQIAVDNSGTATDGNIYVTQNDQGGPGTPQAIDIFASSGEYLGQITGPGGSTFQTVGGFGVSPCGVAVDTSGNLYVGGWREEAIYKFHATANPPTNADLLASFPTDSPCQIAAGAGPSAGSLFATNYNGSSVSKINSSSGAFDYFVHRETNDAASQLAVYPANGHLLVSTSGGASKGIVDYDATQSSGATLVSSFGTINGGVAVDGSTGRVYAGAGSLVRVYSPLVPLPEPTTTAATDIGETSATVNGTVEPFGKELTECTFEYGLTSAYGQSASCAESFAQIGTGSAKVHADLNGLDQEATYHYRLVIANSNGAAKPQGEDRTFHTKSKPEIIGLWAQDVGLHEATLKAQINPQSAATTYRFEWGLTEAPYEHATADIAIGSEPTPHTVGLFLQQLAAGTTYHYRLIAENELGLSEAPDRSFTTFNPTPPPETDCPNQALRTAASAFLPDCRAYEMVSPVDKNGGDIVSNLSGAEDPGGYVQTTADGGKLTYGVAFTAFAGQPAGLVFNQYMAQRGGGGWSNEGIHPPVPGHLCCESLSLGLSREFSAFSPDLCSAWLYDPQGPPLLADGQQGYPNLYRRQNCGAGTGSLETLTSSPPALPSGTPKGYVNAFSVQGFSEDGGNAFFVATAKLNDEEGESGGGHIYDRFGGENHLVSVLPSGLPDETNASVGSGSAGFAAAGAGNLDNAVSDNGSQVYWTSGISNPTSGEGKIYVRSHPEQGRVDGECDPVGAHACTRPASAGANAFYWTAANDGSKALFSEGENLIEFDLEKAEEEEPPRRLIAHDVAGVAGASEDLSRIYFVSTDALNGEAEGEEPGEPNLYLGEGGTARFVLTLAGGDLGKKEPGGSEGAYAIAADSPYRRATRVTRDGSRIAFESRAPLTGYDNTDPATGKPAVEVFTYEAGGDLVCVSCNPSGAAPSVTRELRLPYLAASAVTPEFQTKVPAAAWIPTWEHKLHASNVLSADGTRIFFNANDALLPRDTNGTQDVYEWEAPGAGRCTEQSPSFFATNGGCLFLISSGQSPSESEFWEADADGSDVFFTTSSSLLPQDPGSVDLYDARVQGGFPQPTVPAACEGEACQSPPAPPNDPTPGSSSFEGAGNVVEPTAKKCPKGRVMKGGKCVKKHKKAKDKKKHDKRHAESKGSGR